MSVLWSPYISRYTHIKLKQTKRMSEKEEDCHELRYTYVDADPDIVTEYSSLQDSDEEQAACNISYWRIVQEHFNMLEQLASLPPADNIPAGLEFLLIIPHVEDAGPHEDRRPSEYVDREDLAMILQDNTCINGNQECSEEPDRSRQLPDAVNICIPNSLPAATEQFVDEEDLRQIRRDGGSLNQEKRHIEDDYGPNKKHRGDDLQN